MSKIVAALRLGDKSDHGEPPIIARSNAYYDNKAFSHIGTKAGCDAMIITGDQELRIHGYPKA